MTAPNVPENTPLPPSDPVPDAGRDAERRVTRVKREVLARIAEASSPRHLTIPAGPAGWEPFIDGIQIKVLHEHEGTLSYLLKLSPGAVLPGHRHPKDEECIVMEGELQIGEALAVGPGAYHLARAGALHADITTHIGAVIFLRGACPDVSHAI